MSRNALDSEDPDRLYTVTGGRSRADDEDLDLVTLIVGESYPAPGMQSEHAQILHLCRYPTSVVEIASELDLPVSVVKILITDLLAHGRVTARHPSARRTPDALPDPAFLERVLVGLHNL